MLYSIVVYFKLIFVKLYFYSHILIEKERLGINPFLKIKKKSLSALFFFAPGHVSTFFLLFSIVH